MAEQEACYQVLFSIGQGSFSTHTTLSHNGDLNAIYGRRLISLKMWTQPLRM